MSRNLPDRPAPCNLLPALVFLLFVAVIRVIFTSMWSTTEATWLVRTPWSGDWPPQQGRHNKAATRTPQGHHKEPRTTTLQPAPVLGPSARNACRMLIGFLFFIFFPCCFCITFISHAFVLVSSRTLQLLALRNPPQVHMMHAHVCFQTETSTWEQRCRDGLAPVQMKIDGYIDYDIGKGAVICKDALHFAPCGKMLFCCSFFFLFFFFFFLFPLSLFFFFFLSLFHAKLPRVLHTALIRPITLHSLLKGSNEARDSLCSVVPLCPILMTNWWSQKNR